MKEKLQRFLIHKLLPGGYYFSHDGFCICCEQQVTFQSYDSWLRDNYICTSCGCIPRERALMATIEKYYPGWRDLKIHESSPVNRGASVKIKKHCANYMASQYYPNRKLGEYFDGFRNENLESQTFPDELFDLVITQDVMEHVYHPELVFKEIARTLKKGGAHIFTVPVINKHFKTEVWATLNPDGTPFFLHKPEYHGNPIDPQGSPVTMHWGFDMIEFIKRVSELETEIVAQYNKNFGIMGEYNEVFVTKKI
jgi:hypothetical protein